MSFETLFDDIETDDTKEEKDTKEEPVETGNKKESVPKSKKQRKKKEIKPIENEIETKINELNIPKKYKLKHEYIPPIENIMAANRLLFDDYVRETSLLSVRITLKRLLDLENRLYEKKKNKK